MEIQVGGTAGNGGGWALEMFGDVLGNSSGGGGGGGHYIPNITIYPRPPLEGRG